MKTEILEGAQSFITCNSCKVTIVQDTGKPEDVPIVKIAVKGHLETPNTFLGEINHEILTVDAKDGTYRQGLYFKKSNKIN